MKFMPVYIILLLSYHFVIITMKNKDVCRKNYCFSCETLKKLHLEINANQKNNSGKTFLPKLIEKCSILSIKKSMNYGFNLLINYEILSENLTKKKYKNKLILSILSKEHKKQNRFLHILKNNNLNKLINFISLNEIPDIWVKNLLLTEPFFSLNNETCNALWREVFNRYSLTNYTYWITTKDEFNRKQTPLSIFKKCSNTFK